MKLHTDNQRAGLQALPDLRGLSTASTMCGQNAGAEDALEAGASAAATGAAHEDVEAARIAVRDQTRRQKRVSGTTTLLLTGFTAIYTAAAQWLLHRFSDDAVFWTRTFPTLTVINLLLVFATSIGLLWQSITAGRRIKRHAAILAQDTTGSSLGALVDVLRSENCEARREARQALTVQLPAVRPEEARRALTAAHRAALNRILLQAPEELGHKDVRELFRNTSKGEVDFRVAILRAYRQIGDEEALPVVEALATRRPATAGQRQVQAEAIECLPFLRIAAERQSARGTLLRGSSRAATGEAALLRPAAASAEPAAAHLLRPLDARTQ